jgi:hypothetical protein
MLAELVMGRASNFKCPESEIRRSGRTSDPRHSLFVFSGLLISYVRRIVRRTSEAGHSYVRHFKQQARQFLAC